jgi:hypothetical protein
MDLAKNNIDAQISLMKDILQNYNHIIYHITNNCKEVSTLLGKRVFSHDKSAVSLTKEEYDCITELIEILCNQERYEQLGILAKTAVPDNKVKLNILSILQKS